jgi:hypothetical protein
MDRKEYYKQFGTYLKHLDSKIINKTRLKKIAVD